MKNNINPKASKLMFQLFIGFIFQLPTHFVNSTENTKLIEPQIAENDSNIVLGSDVKKALNSMNEMKFKLFNKTEFSKQSLLNADGLPMVALGDFNDDKIKDVAVYGILETQKNHSNNINNKNRKTQNDPGKNKLTEVAILMIISQGESYQVFTVEKEKAHSIRTNDINTYLSDNSFNPSGKKDRDVLLIETDSDEGSWHKTYYFSNSLNKVVLYDPSEPFRP